MFWDCFYMLCEKAGIKPNPLARDLGISSGSITKWKNGGIPNGETLIKIADYFGCSVDYLLGRDAGNHFNIKNTGDNVGVVGQSNAPVTMQGKSEYQLSVQEKDLLRIYNQADGKTQLKLMNFAYEIDDKSNDI